MAGSSTVAQAIAPAVSTLRDEAGLELKLDIQTAASAAIEGLGTENVNVAMSTRPISPEERAAYPAKRFHEILIGTQAIVPIVSEDVWASGVRALSKEQLIRMYELDIKNWKELGGEDRPIQFYNPERGRGVWELLVTWLYGDMRKAPLGKKFEIVSGSEDARNTVEFHGGALSFTPPKWADGKQVYALALKDDAGNTVEPTVENLTSHKYPLTRPMLLITNDKPAGTIKRFLDFMVSPVGQKFVEKAEFIPAVKAHLEP